MLTLRTCCCCNEDCHAEAKMLRSENERLAAALERLMRSGGLGITGATEDDLRTASNDPDSDDELREQAAAFLQARAALATRKAEA